MNKNLLNLFNKIKQGLSRVTGLSKEIPSFKPFQVKKVNEHRFGYKYMEDLPENLANDLIYIVGEKNHQWMAALICPCGCGAIIQLNLLKRTFPSWKVSIKRGRITIKPSILRIVGCRNHFSITKDRIIYIN